MEVHVTASSSHVRKSRGTNFRHHRIIDKRDEKKARSIYPRHPNNGYRNDSGRERERARRLLAEVPSAGSDIEVGIRPFERIHIRRRIVLTPPTPVVPRGSLFVTNCRAPIYQRAKKPPPLYRHAPRHSRRARDGGPGRVSAAASRNSKQEDPCTASLLPPHQQSLRGRYGGLSKCGHRFQRRLTRHENDLFIAGQGVRDPFFIGNTGELGTL